MPQGLILRVVPDLSGPLKSTASHCCGVRSKKIYNGINATAATDCIAARLDGFTLAFS